MTYLNTLQTGVTRLDGQVTVYNDRTRQSRSRDTRLFKRANTELAGHVYLRHAFAAQQLHVKQNSWAPIFQNVMWCLDIFYF